MVRGGPKNRMAKKDFKRALLLRCTAIPVFYLATMSASNNMIFISMIFSHGGFEDIFNEIFLLILWPFLMTSVALFTSILPLDLAFSIFERKKSRPGFFATLLFLIFCAGANVLTNIFFSKIVSDESFWRIAFIPAGMANSYITWMPALAIGTLAYRFLTRTRAV